MLHIVLPHTDFTDFYLIVSLVLGIYLVCFVAYDGKKFISDRNEERDYERYRLRREKSERFRARYASEMAAESVESGNEFSETYEEYIEDRGYDRHDFAEHDYEDHQFTDFSEGRF